MSNSRDPVASNLTFSFAERGACTGGCGVQNFTVRTDGIIELSMSCLLHFAIDSVSGCAWVWSINASASLSSYWKLISELSYFDSY